jgi:hypothetical protein
MTETMTETSGKMTHFEEENLERLPGLSSIVTSASRLLNTFGNLDLGNQGGSVLGINLSGSGQTISMK